MTGALKLGRIHVFAPDLGQAISFYRDILGLELVQTHDRLLRFAGADFEIDVFECELASDVEGYSREAGSSISFEVADISGAMQELRDKGVQVLHEVPNVAVDGTRYAAFADPFGTVFELIEATPAPMG